MRKQKMWDFNDVIRFTNLPVDTRHRASCHAISDASTYVDFIAEQVFKAAVAKLEELVGIRGST